MGAFLRLLVQSFFGRLHDRKLSFFEATKSLLVTAILPFIFVGLFVPMVMAQESFIYALKTFFGDGVLSDFVNMFWSVHINFCVSIIYSFKLTVYFNDLYTQSRSFQLSTMGKLK